MSETTYPKLKYQGVEIKPGQNHVENPGYVYRKVNNPDEENALGDGWHDSPRPAIDAFKAGQGARDKTELEQLRARLAELEAGGAAAESQTHESGSVQTTDHEGRPRATEEWPVEGEKRRRR